jgi:hypothetical protein
VPHGVPFRQVAASLLVPGLGIYFRGPRFLGKVAMGFGALLALIFVQWLGYPAANVAFGLLLSLHVTSLVYLLEPRLAGARFSMRVLFSLIVLATLASLLYLPIRNGIQAHLFTPLRVEGRVVVVRKYFSLRALQRGDLLAYEFGESASAGFNVQGGVGLGPVLALPGDRVQFSGATFAVNGQLRPSLKRMPAKGEFLVPEKHWFVWPEVAISGHGDVPAEAVSATLLQLGTLPEDQLLGRPCQRWFWRRQQ